MARRRSGIVGPSRLLATLFLLNAWTALAATSVIAAEVRVAVAANFIAPAEQIAAVFESSTGHEVRLSSGSTGALYAQITQGAPFAILLAADDFRPSRAVDEGYGVADTVFTYAIGRLALFSPLLDMSDGQAALSAGDFTHLAIADPETAPYGAAALEVLEALDLSAAILPKLVTGQSVAQALQFVKSGNAEIGLLAVSQVLDESAGQVWRIPATLHTPVRQDAVLLRMGEGNEAALAFLAFLKSDEAHKIIDQYGYDVPD